MFFGQILMRLLKITRKEDSVFLDIPSLSPGWFMNLSVESSLFALNEVTYLSSFGRQAYSCTIMEITVLHNHNTVVTCQGWHEHDSHGSGLVGNMSSTPCFCVGSTGLFSPDWLLESCCIPHAHVQTAELGSKKPLTGTSIVTTSFG